jgi:signal transduction histidine kinase/ActR/RegA family two-component response regulator
MDATASPGIDFSELGNTLNEAEAETLLNVLAEVKAGDLTARMPLGWTGLAGKVADWLNEVIVANETLEEKATDSKDMVREISEIASAVAEGDLTRQVGIEAFGEVGVMKDKLNDMLRNLRETTRQNIEEDWLKTNREGFTRMLQGQRDLGTVTTMILSELAPLVSAQHAVFYVVTKPSDGTEPVLQLEAGYGFEERRNLSTSFRFGEGLVGQCAKEKKRILLTDVPSDYVQISSGLGASTPLNIIVLPVLFEGSVRAVIELASFTPFSVTHQAFLDKLPESIGLVLNTIEADMVTANLLEQSQSQAQELRSQQEELRESNEDLEGQAQLLAERNKEVERSKQLLEDKAQQLSLSSRYKSEFIANMSHELRTPLNSLLILAEQLQDNPGDTMTETQVEYASVIRSSGNDLLALLNSILDLAKAESGTVKAEKNDVSISELATGLLRDFNLIAESKGLVYSVDVAKSCPKDIVTDNQRLRQILTNLLSNAFKFTDEGSVRVRMKLADGGWSKDRESLVSAPSVLAISVSDTGIGIDEEIQPRIFEAFAQGDGSTARVYGGTGLGLSISREFATLLSGELVVESALGDGSTFTIFLPLGAEKRSTGSNGVFAPVVLEPVQDAVEWPSPAGKPVAERRDYTLEASTFGGAKVFVVDDDFRNVFAMKALLERGDAKVTFAESGQDAIDMLTDGPDVDIVLMDIMMPGMDGYATIRAIRKLERCVDLPIIAVTGKVMAGERQRCLDAGANDYVPKPVDTGELVNAISPWLPTLVAAVVPWRPAAAATP